MSAKHKGKAARYRRLRASRGRAGRGASASDRMAAMVLGKPVIIGVDLSSRPDITAVWCSTCGVSIAEGNECPACAQWWADNPPPEDVMAPYRDHSE